MAWSTPTTRTPLTHRMTHNQPQQQPHRNTSPRSTTENSPVQAARPRTAGTPYQASRRPHPSSKPKGPQARQRDEGQQDSISSQQAAAPPHHRGQPHPGSKPEAKCARAPVLLILRDIPLRNQTRILALNKHLLRRLNVAFNEGTTPSRIDTHPLRRNI